MTIQQIVDPSRIEPELLKIWDGVAKEKMRACLFNLIVFNKLSPRSDYIRDIVNKVSEKYPCRVIFISYDPDASVAYLKTAVSIVGTGNVACDYIDIGVAGPKMDEVPFVLLPHIIPDLPVSLLWAEDPSVPHPLFEPLLKLSGRVIFDSEAADNLLAFAKTVLALKAKYTVHFADLNWARTEGWRDLLASLFRSNEVDTIKEMKIIYNDRSTEVFCHLKIQSFYLLAWIASRLNWSFEKAESMAKILFKKQTASIVPTTWEKLGSGTIIGVNISTYDDHTYECARIPTQYHHVAIQSFSSEKCELPYRFILGRTATGHSLVTEIINKGTSEHYLQMLSLLLQMDQDKLC